MKNKIEIQESQLSFNFSKNATPIKTKDSQLSCNSSNVINLHDNNVRFKDDSNYINLVLKNTKSF